MHDGNVYRELGELFEYPANDWRAHVRACTDLEVSVPFTHFREAVASLSLSDLQELYTRTFDLNPVCALEIGYHLFGENYKRGEFLANLRQTEAPFQLGQEKQLPDYLPVLLRLITQLQDEELLNALIAECLVPAVGKMIKAVNGDQNPYRYLLEALDTQLRANSIEVVKRPQLERASLPVLQTGATAPV